MDLSKYTSDGERSEIVNLIGFRPYIILDECLKRCILDQTEIAIAKPVIDNENLKRDFRFSLGRIQGMKDALEFIQNCKEMVEDDLL